MSSPNDVDGDSRTAFKYVVSIAEKMLATASEDITVSELLAVVSHQNLAAFAKTRRLSQIRVALYSSMLAAALLTARNKHRLMVINQLAEALYEKYRVFNRPPDLDRAISILEEAVRAWDGHDPSMQNALSSLMIFEEAKYDCTYDISHLEEAIKYAERAVAVTGPDHKEKSLVYHNLGDKLSALYDRTGKAEHLERGFAAAAEAVRLAPKDHPNRSGYLNNLVKFIATKAKITKCETQVDEALQLAKEVVAGASKDDTRYPLFVNNLSLRFADRFNYSKNPDDIAQAIHFACQIIGDARSERPDHMLNLASLYFRRYGEYGNSADIDEAIRIGRKAVNLTNSDRKLQAGAAANLSRYLEASYAMNGKEDLLEDALSHADIAVDAALPLSPDRGDHLELFSRLLLERFRRSRNMSDLNKAIVLAEEAVKAPTYDVTGIESRWPIFSNLAVNMAEAFTYESTLDSSHVDRAYEMAVRARSHVSAKSKAYPVILNNMAAVLQHKLLKKDSADDLAQAISLVEAALKHPCLSDKNRPMLLNNLAYFTRWNADSRSTLDQSVVFVEDAVRTARLIRDAQLPRYLDSLASLELEKYIETSDPEHIERSCSLSEECVLTVSKKDTLLLAQYRHNAALRFSTKAYSQVGTREDMERATFFAQAALSATPITHYLYRTYLQTYASMLGTEYQRYESLPRLVKAIEVMEEVLALTPPNHPKRDACVQVLSTLYLWHYEAGKDPKSLDRALELSNEAVELRPNHAGAWSLLANIWETKFEVAQNTTDLDKAIELARKAVERTDEHDWEYSGFLRNLANKYNRRYGIAHSKDDYQAAVETYIRAFEAMYSPPRSLVLAARNAAKMQAGAGDFVGASDSLSRALDQLPKLRPRYFERQDEQDVLAEHHSLACDAAAYALAAGKEPYEALSMLERGNAVILGSVIDSRSDVSELQDKQPQLYDELNRLRRELDLTTPSMEHRLGEDGIPIEETRTLRHKRKLAAERLDELLAEIRDVDTFEEFLLAPGYKKLLRLAEDGPLVVLNHSIAARRLDALIITTDGIEHLPLSAPIGTGNPPGDSFVLESDIYSGPFRTRGVRNEKLRFILKKCWDSTIERICMKLGYTHRNDPLQLPHVWFVRVGYPYNILPVHATGDNTPGSVNMAHSRFVASYAPSIKALSYAREKALTFLEKPGPRLLVATMSETPGNMRPLKGVLREASAINALVNNKMGLVELSQPSAEQVLGVLTSCNAAHFSCHGHKGGFDPSRSALVFQKEAPDGSKVIDLLEVRSISISNHTSGADMQLAYLSACASAGSDNQLLADESIHVASSFLLAGFSHVIGTFWDANDDICVDVASEFWRYMMEGRDVSETPKERHRRVRLALHAAVVKVREAYWDQPLFWAPFVHFGA